MSNVLEERRRSARVFARLESDVYAVKVPQTVIGEAVATIMRDFDPGDWEMVIGKVVRTIGSVADPATCFPPPEPAVAEVAGQMMARVKGLTKTDALVAAQALMDPVSQKLVTKDNLLISSVWLIEEEQRMRRDGERLKHLRFEDNV